jgi:hypothetical protein
LEVFDEKGCRNRIIDYVGFHSCRVPDGEAGVRACRSSGGASGYTGTRRNASADTGGRASGRASGRNSSKADSAGNEPHRDRSAGIFAYCRERPDDYRFRSSVLERRLGKIVEGFHIER